jgi:chlorinating enzyme
MRTVLDKEKYLKEGIDWPIQAFKPAELTSFYQRYLAFQQKATQIRGKATFIKPHLISILLDQIVHNDVIVKAVEAAIGPDIVLWSSDIAIKEAGKGSYVPWHQDTPYWNLSSTEVVSVWFALTEAKVANGAMQVIPGTHKQGALGKLNIEGDPHKAYKEGKRTSSEGNIFAYDHDMLVPVNEDDAISVELEPGEFSLHNIELLHGGGPNPSDEDRVGFVMRFMSASTFCRTGKDSVTHIRGIKNNKNFVYEPRPTSDCAPASMTALQSALQYPSGFGDRKVQ